MRIRVLELYGFKSFPDRTRFQFGHGVSCIVGPNGCGKSNVVDAVKWCIGERSARSLRGQDMQDVIFAGSMDRSPVGFAEVSLTFDAGEERFPGEFAHLDQVQVTRRLHRSGTSEYQLNQVKCRLKDITSLFLDTGVSSDLYSFIEQGKVDKVVNATPAERRLLIDEAAGISKYKIRREEAMQRLSATGSQLDRAADVADEMGRRLRSLERQVVKAARFRRLRALIRQDEIALSLAKYAALAGDRRALRSRVHALRGDQAATQRETARRETDLVARREELAVVDAATTTWRDEVAELDATQRELSSAASVNGKRAAELGQQAVASTHDADLAREEATSASQRLEAALGDHEALEVRSRQLTQAHQESTTRLTVAQDVKQRARGDRDGSRDALGERRQEFQRAARAAREGEAQVRALQMRLDEVGREDERARAEFGAIDAELERTRRGAEPAERALDEAVALVQTLEGSVEDPLGGELQSDLLQAEAALDRAREKAALRRRELEQRMDALREESAAELRDTRNRHRKRREQAEAAARKELGSRDASLRESEREATTRAILWRSEAIDQSKRHREVARSQVDQASSHRDRVRSQVSRKAAEMEAMTARLEALEPPTDFLPGVPRLADRTGDLSDPIAAYGDFLDLPVLTSRAQVQEALDSASDGTLLWWRGDPLADVPSKPTSEDVLTDFERSGASGRSGSLLLDHKGVLRWGEHAAVARLRERQQLAEKIQSAREGFEAMVAEQAKAEQHLAQRRSCLEASEAAYTAATQLDAEAGLAGLRTDREQSLEGLRERQAQELRELAETLAREEASVEAQAREAQEQMERQLTELGSRQEALLEQRRDDLLAVRSRATAFRDRQETLLSELNLARDNAAEARVHASEVASEIRHLAERQASLEQRRAELAELASTYRDSVQAEEQRVEACLETEAKLGERVREAEGTVQSLERALEVADAAERQVADELAALDAERAGVAGRLDATAHQVRELESVVARATEREQRARESSAGLSAQASEAEAAQKSALAEVSELETRRAAAWDRLERERGRVKALREGLAGAEDALRGLQERFAAQAAELAAAEQELQRVQMEVDVTRQRISERYQESLPGLLDRLEAQGSLLLTVEASVIEGLTIGNATVEGVEPRHVYKRQLDDEAWITAAVPRLEEHRNQLSRLGEVNLAALAEYEELAERHSELEAQRNDLDASVTAIRAAIAKMNRLCRQRFRDAFDQVNEAFQQSYPRLVGGGSARLSLTDEEDLLDTGVEIYVQPPGKRLTNLQLLSGGEKAMTAIALLLALFRVKPSPFCILDEVDAPLDEANGARFNDMLREMAQVSQFLVITHNRKTMECADTLYGVTMPTPGVSRLVSVDLDHAWSGAS